MREKKDRHQRDRKKRERDGSPPPDTKNKNLKMTAGHDCMAGSCMLSMVKTTTIL